MISIKLYRKSSHVVIRYTRSMPVAAALGFLAAGLIIAFDDISFISWVLAAIFFSVSAFLFLKFCTWRVEDTLENGTMQVCTLFRRHVISVEQIIGVTERSHGGILYLDNGRKIRIDGATVGWGQFLDEIEQYNRYILHRGLAIPPVPEKLFNGYLQNPTEFITCFVLLGVFFTIAVFVPYFMCRPSLSLQKDDCIVVTIEHFSAELDGNSFILSTQDDVSYRCRNMNYYSDENDRAAMMRRLDDATECTMLIPTQEWNTKNERLFVNIRELTIHDSVLVSFVDGKCAVWGDIWPPTIVCVICWTLYLCFVTLFCYFVSRAPRYPKIVACLVKERYLT